MELSALKYPTDGVIAVGTDLKMLLVCLKSRERNPKLYRCLNKNILPRRDKAGPLVFRRGGRPPLLRGGAGQWVPILLFIRNIRDGGQPLPEQDNDEIACNRAR
ncbi:unnamed protein product [Nezara viridula]|uniref:Uncharacterized protein n=1 Tax=Nezara viridula TaxID=85310 RepID=A0A9P0ML04_NEZVI|nr:unnamed protein product [Nezara viridula]